MQQPMQQQPLQAGGLQQAASAPQHAINPAARQTAELSCPKVMVGRVIGKNGETIKALQMFTGALIQIDQSVEPTRVTVSGNTQSLSLALSMISDVCKGTFKGFALLRQMAQSTRGGASMLGLRPVYAPGYGLIPPSQLYGADGQQLGLPMVPRPDALQLPASFQYLQSAGATPSQMILGMPGSHGLSDPQHAPMMGGSSSMSPMALQQLYSSALPMGSSMPYGTAPLAYFPVPLSLQQQQEQYALQPGHGLQHGLHAMQQQGGGALQYEATQGRGMQAALQQQHHQQPQGGVGGVGMQARAYGLAAAASPQAPQQPQQFAAEVVGGSSSSSSSSTAAAGSFGVPQAGVGPGVGALGLGLYAQQQPQKQQQLPPPQQGALGPGAATTHGVGVGSSSAKLLALASRHSIGQALGQASGNGSDGAADVWVPQDVREPVSSAVEELLGGQKAASAPFLITHGSAPATGQMVQVMDAEGQVSFYYTDGDK